MAQVITARLSRNDAQPWGFRLQGGKDFGTPLVIQKVNTGSIADNAGLKAGDAVVRINATDLYNLRHKDAQDCIVKAGPSFELVVQRGGATWKPSVTPIGSAAPSPLPGSYAPVTKTSLAANKQQVSNFGSGHNSAARPFQSGAPARAIGNKQYNTPVAIYSDESIAESLSSQAEVLAGGVLGVNFKKNEKAYNPENSEVLKALQENDSEPEPAGSKFYWRQSHAIGGSATSGHTPRPLTPSYQVIPDDRMGQTLQQNSLAPSASHRPSLPVQPKVNPTTAQSSTNDSQENKTIGASAISSALSAHAGNLNGNAPSNFSAPKPFSYSAPSAGPPMAGPKSPSTYPPPTQQQSWAPAPQPAWSPPTAAAPKPTGPVQEPDPDYKAETFRSVFSNRKETWQKLTTTNTFSSSRDERQEETFEATDDNPENSDEDHNNAQQHEEDEEENDVEAEIQGQHVGPHDGTYYQLPPSNIPQPTPKKYMTDFHKALITTSERPYSIFDLAPTPEPKLPNLDFYEEAVREAEKYPIEEEKPKPKPKEIPKFEVKTNKHDIEFPYDDADVRRGSLIASMMRTASPNPVEFVKSNIIEEIQLPDEESAYFPPPISMQPHEAYGDNVPHRTKSPFVGALTTVPDRPYTPFGREIMSQLSMDIPAGARNVTFSNALRTAPDDSFDPSSLECEYEPIEYTAQVYERIAEEIEAENEVKQTRFAHVTSPINRTYPEPFNAKLQPWSCASEQVHENSYTDSMSGHESLECHVSESRRCSEFQRRRSSVAQGNNCDNRRCSQGQCSGCENCQCKISESRRTSQAQCESRRTSQVQCESRRTSQGQCDTRRCSQAMKPISDLLKTKVSEEEEFDPDKPNPNAPYPRRMQPSPFEGMQVKITNKMTSGLHKPDEIPTYQRKWFNLPTQNPPKTPEPEELRENIPMAFKEWPTSQNVSRRSSIGAADSQAPSWHRTEVVRASVADSGMSLKPPARQEFPTSTQNTSVFPVSTSTCESTRSSVCREQEEANDFVEDFKFPTKRPPPKEGIFPTRGIRKNSLADVAQQQKTQLTRQRDLQHELKHQQLKMSQKQKSRQEKELKYLNTTTNNQRAEEVIREEIQQNTKLSHYEMEQEYKRQLELERQQQQKEQEIREQQAREVEYQRQVEEQRLREAKNREKREHDLQLQTQREMEYRKQREEQEEEQRRQQEQRDLELRKQQEEMETEIRRQQEREKRMAEAREAQRLFEIRRKEERDRELARLEEELRTKREEELKQLQREIREKREEQQREQREAEEKIRRDQKAREDAEKEQRRLEEEAKKEREERDRSIQRELKWRQKQDADRKQREETELFNVEEEKRRQKTYSSSTYQQQTVWPPSGPPTPAPTQIQRQVPIIKTDSETELNATKFRFEPLDEEQRRFMASIRPPSTCYSPATEDKPFPAIPYYQQHLVFVEAEANHQGIFNPKVISPTPNRSRSPAFGPPPNPLRAFVNKERDPELDESGIYLCGERLLSPIWYDKQHKTIPPPVQRKIPLRGSPRPPSKPDLAALSEAVRKHKQLSGSKPPPPPPPMPSTSQAQQKPLQRRESGDESAAKQTEEASTELQIPKGSVGQPGALPKHGRTFTTSGPNRGQGVLTQPSTGRVPICGGCASQVRGPFITALGKTWCPSHFLCVNPSCKRELVDIGFVEEKGDLYCEYCFEQFLAPPCGKCNGKIKGDCLNAIGKKFHPECFKCTYCGKLFGNSPFFLEEGDAYCEADWNELFTTKCFACGFPVEAGDRWVEALNNNYHSQCFNCTYCKKNLEGQSFFAKGGRPFCKAHAR